MVDQMQWLAGVREIACALRVQYVALDVLRWDMSPGEVNPAYLGAVACRIGALRSRGTVVSCKSSPGACGRTCCLYFPCTQ